MVEVLICGGGPVGMGLAIELGQRGVDVGVVEQHVEPQRIPKGQNLTQRTMEHMAAWDVEDAVREAKTIPRGIAMGGLTAYGSLLSGYHYDWYKRATVRPYYHADNERLPQYATEAVLRARVAELDNVEVHYGWRVEAMEQTDSRVTVTAVEHEGDARKTLEAQYVVGCDGARSHIRQAAAITETRNDHDRLMVLIVFRSPAFFDLIERFPDKQFYNVLHPDLDGYWMFFGMVEWGQSFFFHAPVPADTTRENFDFEGYIHRAVGTQFPLELEYVGFWDLRIALANQYRAGRAFIAGDAAHSHPPYGGYGINTGFEDARNLGWKLAAALRGWAGERLLDSYEAERRPVFASTARDFIERFIIDDRAFVRAHDPDRDLADFEAAWAERAQASANLGIATFAPHYSGSPIIVGGANDSPSAVGAHEFTARAGHHLPPRPLPDGTSTGEHLGSGFTFFSLNGDERPAARLRQAAAGARVPLSVVTVTAEEARKAYGRPLVLVRPDGFVAWAGEAIDDEAALLASVCGH